MTTPRSPRLIFHCLATLLLLWTFASASAAANYTFNFDEDISHVRGRNLKYLTEQQWTEETGMVFSEGPYIVNGDTANTALVPWFVHFGNGACGGSLVSPNVVLTAAHCVRRGAPSTVRVGATTQSDGREVRVRCANTHPGYDGFVTNDVAVLKLAEDVPDASVVTINTDAANPAVGQELTVIGLGRTSTGGGVSNTLLAINQNYVDPAACSSAYGGGADPNFHLCAVIPNKGACNGDSGGPLFDANLVQVGIVSFGSSQGCASNVPDGYTRVSFYAQWIQEQIADDSCDGCNIWAIFCIQCRRVWGTILNAAASVLPDEE